MSLLAEHQGITPRSVVRYRPIGATTHTPHITTERASRKAQKQLPHTTGGPPFVASIYQHRYSIHWMMPVGIAMAVMVIVIWLFQIIWAWGMLTYDDLRYGRPRTTQIDGVVGHQDSVSNPTHLIAINLHGRIEILELPGGDPTHARMLVGPQLSGNQADLAPVTLQLVKRNGGRIPDLLVQCDGIDIWYRNLDGTFTPP